MRISKDQIQEVNHIHIQAHEEDLGRMETVLRRKGLSMEELIEKVGECQIAIPSWALGAGGTRFGRFSIGENLQALRRKWKM